MSPLSDNGRDTVESKANVTNANSFASESQPERTMSRIVGFVAAGAIGAVVAGYNYFTEADRDSSGEIVNSGNLSSFEMRVGDCFNDTDAFFENDEVSSIPAVPCSESHDNEVYAVFNLGSEKYPGDDVVYDLASDGCLDRFQGFVGRDYESSALDFFAIYPTRDSWQQLNDREVVCSLYDMELAKLEGSVKGLGI